ncbi:MAG TPA: capsular polysaccharide biosynthesis protein, partial [Marinobacter sp.]|nr:capsular polysaccharide biosynthesis protein [Marinobacter sp.]
GWGLTPDINPLARRVRKASLNELVAAALIQYPTYISRVTGRFTIVEQVIDEIAEQRRLGGGQPTVFQRFSRRVRAHRRF